MTIDQTKQAIVEEFKRKFDARIGACEFSYQNHGGSPWTGQTIPEWLSESLDRMKKRMIEELEQLPTGSFDSTPYKKELIESLKKGVK